MVALLSTNDDITPFPALETASTDPDGLIAIGGALSTKRILAAYQSGIFPWYNDDNEPVLWWSPDPRLVLFPENLKISRSLQKTLKNGGFTVTFDQAFVQVIEACAGKRATQKGTWITAKMQQAYARLHTMGFAHSVECWYKNELVGGLYGISLGHVFFGESMFQKKSNASKVAFAHLVDFLKTNHYAVIDCQEKTDHLISLGAEEIPRSTFAKILQAHSKIDTKNIWPTRLNTEK
jgi:leucyl/phenylalanyl-tRNA---protein transferase